MSKSCKVCGIRNIFYIWSTSRYFNKKKLLSLQNNPSKSETYDILHESYTVCQYCVNKYGLMNQ